MSANGQFGLAMQDHRQVQYQPLSLGQAFVKTALAFPERTAIIDPTTNQKLSYQQLLQQARAVAAWLLAQNLGPEHRIGIYCTRSPWQVASIMGVLMAGAAYVPLDPDYPAARIQYLVQDAGLHAVLYNKMPLPKTTLPQAGVHTLAPPASGQEPAMPKVPPGSLAYIIYTSGSTGQPKGVGISHENVHRLLFTQKPVFQFDEYDVWTLFHSISFDFSVWEIFGALLHGAALLIVPKTVAREPEQMARLLYKQKVTVFNCIPSAFVPISKALVQIGGLLALHYVIFGGEALHPTTLKAFHAKYPGVKLINMYGITETTVHVTWQPITQTHIEQGQSVLGQPLPTMALAVVNEQGQPVQAGQVGELLVAGAGVSAFGYWQKPALTQQRFVQLPALGPGTWYRSGDLALLNEEGQFIYQGRADHQVKINGFRIETQEVASALMAHEQVQQAVVSTVADALGHTVLVAFYQGSVARQDLATWLATQLPAHMVPARWAPVKQFPLSPSGKINVKALHDLLPQQEELQQEESQQESAQAKQPAGTPPTQATGLAQALGQIWQQVLPGVPIKGHINFFQEGGHSLLAIHLAGLVNQKFGTNWGVKEVFQQPVFEQQLALLSAHKGQGFMPIAPAPTQSSYPVGPAQQRLWLLQRIEPNMSAYHIQDFRLLPGTYKAQQVRQALLKVVSRHEMLRTVFTEQEGQLRQVVKPDTVLRPGWQILPPYVLASQQSFTQWWQEHLSQPFDLANGPLIRAAWGRLPKIKNAPAVDVVVLAMHHIVADAHAMQLLWQELMQALEQDNAWQPAPLMVHYKDYAVWLQQQRQEATWNTARQWWLNLYQNKVPVLELPQDFARPTLATYAGAMHTFTVPPLPGLLGYLQQEGISHFMLMLGLWGQLLGHHAQQNQLVIGTPVSLRNQPALQGPIGFFTNTLPLLVQLAPHQSVPAFFKALKAHVLEAFTHQDYPFDELVQDLELPRMAARQPLFNVMLVVQHSNEMLPQGAEVGVPEDEAVGTATATNSPALPHVTSKYDLTLFITVHSNGLTGSIEYSTDLFLPQRIQQMATQFVQLLQAVVALPHNTSQSMQSLPWQQPTAQQNLRQLLQGPQVPLPWPSVPHMLAAACKGYAARPALEDSAGRTLTYEQVAQQAAALALALQQAGVQAHQNVAVLLSRSVRWPVAMLGVMGAGAVYVPIEVTWPTGRIAQILQDVGPAAIVLEPEHEPLVPKSAAPKQATPKQATPKQAAPEPPAPKLDITRLPASPATPPATWPLVPLQPHHPAFMVYTSGSTGKPKGVVLHHGTLVNLAHWQRTAGGIGHGNKLLQMVSVGFDVSLQDVACTLLAGGCLHIVHHKLRLDFNHIWQLIKRAHIQHLSLPFSLMDLMFRHPDAQKATVPGLKHIVSSGEALVPSPALQAFLQRHPHVYLHNHYGPSETHVITAWRGQAAAVKSPAPIGRPIYNTALFLKAPHGGFVPQGVGGYLYATGLPLALAYWNDSTLTQQKFTTMNTNEQDPNAAKLPAYDTGDKANLNWDGDLEFEGRDDDQVKVNGFRVELAEVVKVIEEAPGVEKALVLIDDSTDKPRLIAYFTAQEEVTLTSIRSHAAKYLPGAILPAAYAQIEAVPLNANGKVDRAQLPAVQEVGIGSSAPYEPPVSENEIFLAKQWQELLQVARVGIDDNFFELGGNSVRIVQLHEKVEEQFPGVFKVQHLFDKATVRQQAVFIEEAHEQAQNTAGHNEEEAEDPNDIDF